jgi:hypothetical protein
MSKIIIRNLAVMLFLSVGSYVVNARTFSPLEVVCACTPSSDSCSCSCTAGEHSCQCTEHCR